MVDSVVGDMKGAPGAEDGFLSIITFADAAEVALAPTPLLRVEPFTNYVPDGYTALYAATDDALSLALGFRDALERRGDGTRLVCNVVVLSDGRDNRSLDRQHGLQVKAQTAREHGFVLQAMGFGIGHEELSCDLGFDPARGVTVPATAEGMHTVTTATSESFAHSMIFDAGALRGSKVP